MSKELNALLEGEKMASGELQRVINYLDENLLELKIEVFYFFIFNGCDFINVSKGLRAAFLMSGRQEARASP